MITAHSVFSSEERFPVYCKYPGQYQNQPAFIALDLETGEVDAGYSGEIGNAIPSPVFHGIVIRFPIRPESTADMITEMISSNLENFQTVLDGSSIEWDGSNYVGRLSESASDLVNEMQCSLFDDCQEGGIIDDLGTYLDGNIDPDGQSFEDFAHEIFSYNGDNDYWFSSDLDSAEKIQSALLDLWADQLYAGDDIPRHVAQALIADGRCDDSQWTDELSAFAK